MDFSFSFPTVKVVFTVYVKNVLSVILNDLYRSLALFAKLLKNYCTVHTFALFKFHV